MAEKKKGCGCTEKDLAMARQFGTARPQPDGSIMYPRRGHEPPPDLDGYQRDPGNAWKFIPLWKGCPFRTQYQFLKPCGALGIFTMCTHEGCTVERKEVKYRDCITCTLVQLK